MHQKGKVFSLSKEELLAFLGVSVIMGYHTVPKLSDYWSTDEDLAVPAVSRVMSRDRYLEIRSSLHFTDNSKVPPRNSPDFDKANKIRPLIDHLNLAFGNAMNATKHQSCDEKMIKYKVIILSDIVLFFLQL